MAAAAFDRESFADTVRYWEIGRALFNLWLALVVFVPAFMSIGASIANYPHWWEMSPYIALSAIAVNVLYCAVYPVDLVAQATPLRGLWLKTRWLLWVAGTAFATMIALAGVISISAMDAGRF